MLFLPYLRPFSESRIGAGASAGIIELVRIPAENPFHQSFTVIVKTYGENTYLSQALYMEDFYLRLHTLNQGLESGTSTSCSREVT